MKAVLNLVKKRLKKLRILVLYDKDLITETFQSNSRFPLPLNVCLLFVLLFTIFIIVVIRKS